MSGAVRRWTVASTVGVAAMVALGTLACPPRTGAVVARATRASAPPQPCGTLKKASHSITHVIWIWMENESYGSIIGSPAAKYETALARECGLAQNYVAITHPSLPNYLAATGGSTFGVTDDGEPASHPIVASSLFSEISHAHQTWRGYAESMPSNCDRVTAGDYAARHNPAVYYIPLGSLCAEDDVPMGSLAAGALVTAARGGHLPNFSFVTPNICDDAHSCPVARGDAWLSQVLPIVFSGPQYRTGTVAVFLTFDEGKGDNHIPTIVAAESTPIGTISHTPFTHYSLLRTTEQLLHLPYLGRAAGATSMVADFGL